MSERTALRRKKDRGVDDRAALDAIIDEAIVAHVGFTADHGPVVLPMVYARIGDDLYLHGAAGNALLRNLADGGPVCVTITLIDGLVLARSAFHHSANYRCAVIFGTVTKVTDLDEMRRASDALVDHIAHGRAAEVRPPNDTELRSTLMIRLPLDEWSVKVRTRPTDRGRRRPRPPRVGRRPPGCAHGRRARHRQPRHPGAGARIRTPVTPR